MVVLFFKSMKNFAPNFAYYFIIIENTLIVEKIFLDSYLVLCISKYTYTNTFVTTVAWYLYIIQYRIFICINMIINYL